jgi:hypothetical protein
MSDPESLLGDHELSLDSAITSQVTPGLNESLSSVGNTPVTLGFEPVLIPR